MGVRVRKHNASKCKRIPYLLLVASFVFNDIVKN